MLHNFLSDRNSSVLCEETFRVKLSLYSNNNYGDYSVIEKLLPKHLNIGSLLEVRRAFNELRCQYTKHGYRIAKKVTFLSVR